MFPKLKYRSRKKEIMDDFYMDGSILRQTLDKIAWINKWLGGNQLTISGLKSLLKNTPTDQEITIVDLGCGSGDILRIIADIARKENRRVKLIGIDANEFTINYAREKSIAYDEIIYLHQTIPSEEFSTLKYDIVLSTLFLHHFTDEEILTLLFDVCSKAQIGVIINDLHRSQWAYFLFKMLTLFIPNSMVRQDGLISILRGFKRADLQIFSESLLLTNSEIHWKWAFRYQWIINKTK